MATESAVRPFLGGYAKGQTARTRWEILFKGSTLNRFLEEVGGAAVQVVPGVFATISFRALVGVSGVIVAFTAGAFRYRTT